MRKTLVVISLVIGVVASLAMYGGFGMADLISQPYLLVLPIITVAAVLTSSVFALTKRSQ